MLTDVHVVAHLTPDEPEQQYRKANDPVEQSRLQIVWLLARGTPLARFCLFRKPLKDVL